MKFYLLSFLIFICHSAFLQESFEVREYKIVPAISEIKIDGLMDEADWENAEITGKFWLQSPLDGQLAIPKTEVRMLYDDKNIYIYATMYDDNPYVIQSLKRDVFGGSDNFTFLVDPVGQKTNAYAFAVNADGAQTEALIFINGDDSSWDNKWYSATHKDEEKWVVEMAIPFKSMRFEADKDQWAFNFARLDPSRNETHVWSPVPRQFSFIDLGYFGRLNWQKSPSSSGSNISLIPYTTIRHDHTAGENKLKADFGGDAKIALSSSLNLDLTANPDFSQVEVDDQVTNLSRFNIFFPEKRQFFIENADVFSEFGQGADQPFYSRRIGLDQRGNTVPITYGARLTGNVTKDLRIGVLNMHSQTTDQTLGQNYSAIALHQRIGKRSLIKGLFLNRQAFNGSESADGDNGRNFALETVLSTADGRWRATGGYLQSIKENIDADNAMYHGGVYYSGTRFRAFVEARHLGKDYFVDMGFNSRIENYNPINNSVERIGYSQVGSMIDYYVYPEKSEKVNYHWSGLENFVWSNDGFGLTEWYTRLRHFIFFKNSSQIRFRLNNHYIDLIYPFALTEVPVPAKAYNMTEFNVDLRGDQRKLFIPNLFVVYGGFYEGTKLTIQSTMTYRVQPWANFTAGIEYNDIHMPQPYGDLNITALTAKAELSFSTSLFWSTYVQYNTQADNMNINSRMQWRFAPMSDLFFVYTDNYMVENYFGNKNRTFVVKLNYWLSI
jgi:hypothetical protein